ncbi:histidine phosphatase family protein [Gluconobacter sp. Dm-62]|uniref:histidine phosphatase family protein n=1 Tax=Gluconobacter sp. Dm-62 TaxID=2799804 RepID=UPI001B8ABC73|nr:histidine phosphatase family protein [Gluconobacter sp. Dm-62]MBS1103570.1 histidine phosphatase family protein [Gluconobacter sp. Dm-62]
MGRLVCLALGLPVGVKRGYFPGHADCSDSCDPAVEALKGKLVLTGNEADAGALRNSGIENVRVVPSLRDNDYGEWAGQNMRSLPEGDVTRWISDPDFCPPGGESRAMLFSRVGDWLMQAAPSPEMRLALRPAVVRALVLNALGGRPGMERQLDIVPFTVSILSCHEKHWRVQAFGR